MFKLSAINQKTALVGFVGLILIGAIVLVTQQATAKQRPLFYLPPGGENIVYFASNHLTAVSDLPISANELEKIAYRWYMNLVL